MERAEPNKLLNPKKRIGGTREEEKPKAKENAKKEEVKSSDQAQSE